MSNSIPLTSMCYDGHELQFASSPSPSLLCPICHGVFNLPRITGSCNHSFCESCIFTVLTSDDNHCCPLCRHPLGFDDLHPNLALAALTSEIRYHCPNIKMGCNEAVTLDDIPVHLETCVYKPRDCKYARYGCKFNGSEMQTAGHLDVCVYAAFSSYLMAQDERMHALEERVCEQEQVISSLNDQLMSLCMGSGGSCNYFDDRLMHLKERNNAEEAIIDAVIEEEPPAPQWSDCELETTMILQGHSQGVTSLVYHGKLDKIISGSYDGMWRQWNASTGACERAVSGHKSTLWSLAFDKETGFVFSGSSDGTIKSWNLQDDVDIIDPVDTLSEHTSKIYDVKIRDGLLYSASQDRSIKIWDISRSKCISTLTGHTDGVNAIAFCNGDHIASASGDRTVRIWDVNTGECVQTLTQSGEVLALTVGDGMLFCATADAAITAYDLDSGYVPVKAVRRAHRWEIWQLEFVNGVLFSGSFDHTVKRWCVQGSNLASTAELRGHTGYVHAIGQGDNCLFTGCADKTVRIWGPK